MYFSHINTESAEYALGYRSLKTSPVQIAMCSLSSVMISMVSLLNDTEREVQNIQFHNMTLVVQLTRGQNKFCRLHIIIYYQQFIK